MDVTQDHLDAALRLAIDGNLRIGAQERLSVPVVSHATADAVFDLLDEPDWPQKAGQLPLMSSMRLIIDASASAIDLARVISHLTEGGGILTSSVLCRNVFENTATGVWIIRPGLDLAAAPDPRALDTAQEAARRERIERAHVTRWLSMDFYNAGQFKDATRRATNKAWKASLGDRAEVEKSDDGRTELSRIGGTTPAGLGRMTGELEKAAFGTKNGRPRLYDRLSAYGHPNLDATTEMENPSGLFTRDADTMVHEMWLALKLVAEAWRTLCGYAGWDSGDVNAWAAELDDIKVPDLAAPWGG